MVWSTLPVCMLEAAVVCATKLLRAYLWLAVCCKIQQFIFKCNNVYLLNFNTLFLFNKDIHLTPTQDI